MVQLPAGIAAISVAFPSTVRTSDDLRRMYPDIAATSEQRNMARVWHGNSTTDLTRDFDEEMRPYLADPFRGTIQRRLLASGETAESLELKAARDVLAAARKDAQEVDVMLVGSFLPDRLGTGNAPFLARELGLRGAAWNIESACSTTVVGLQTACALVSAGAYRNALLVISCTYSRVHDEADTLGWFMGDGAGAILVEPTKDGFGLLGAHIQHTGESCGAAWYEPVPEGNDVRIRMRAGKDTGRLFRETAGPIVRACCERAAAKAGVSLSDIALFAFNTPTAWYAKFCARALGVNHERAINLYPHFGNMGPALTTTNLYFAAQRRRVKPGDLVMAYSVGSVSTAGALVFRWGDCALGPVPALCPELG
jgi:3-oxoacyl-[acyl-carrier-protein] synthase-3